MNRLFLIGPMGSGKTTVGRHLAERLGLSFLDLDQEIERRCGVDVSVIFEIEGEAGFRQRESAALDDVSRRDGILLATGGGSILSEANRRMLRERGLVVWLKTSVEQQIRRLASDQRRPLLQTPDRRQRLEGLARQRDPLYQACAHLVVQSANISPVRMAARAEREIRAHLDAVE
ncbi:MAG: shikimate kinase [Wenzhouxiangella sp.]|nr:shikimate kinase [Wenzhouxiangella sp.]MCH8477288.1 shikimate kinase [Wenzhouxiangella sp.]